MRVILYRFEGDYAVCEKNKGRMIKISRYKLPEGAKEGDVLIVIGDFIQVDEEST